MKREDISPTIIRELMDCDCRKGFLFWKKRERKWFKSDNACNSWNAKYAGKPAFTAVKDKAHGKGYKIGAIFYHTFKAHRVIWAHCKGKWPDHCIDHIEGVEAGDGIDNLRDATRTQNQRNMRRMKSNKSGVTGVHWDSHRKKWKAEITLNDRNKYLGRFDDKADAIAARKAAELEHGFHPNHGRAE